MKEGWRYRKGNAESHKAQQTYKRASLFVEDVREGRKTEGASGRLHPWKHGRKIPKGRHNQHKDTRVHWATCTSSTKLGLSDVKWSSYKADIKYQVTLPIYYLWA